MSRNIPLSWAAAKEMIETYNRKDKQLIIFREMRRTERRMTVNSYRQ